MPQGRRVLGVALAAISGFSRLLQPSSTRRTVTWLKPSSIPSGFATNPPPRNLCMHTRPREDEGMKTLDGSLCWSLERVHDTCRIRDKAHLESTPIMNCLVLADGHRVAAESLIGSGLDGFIIRHGSGCVLKIPKLFARLQSDGRVEAYSDDANELGLEDLEVEKTVYERLRGVPGVAKCIECTSNGILLEYYANGSLSEYISAHSHNPPSMSQRWRWAIQATDIIARCHERGVLVFDIALRNFVLTENLDLRIIDFANSSLVPLSPSIDFSRVNVIGCTAGLDLLHLSNVIYSIMVWQTFSINCAVESEWPRIDQMPDVKGLDIGQVVHKCWTRKYTGVQDMAPELRLCMETPPSTEPL
ncbi:hypothetical protein LTR53_001021 [Teratosphaeriaceae sp. CCFEE 6253]|nr:hypothetical protein LTR53_001021 [Teratosphaeriaceae sp. CCFEE 6253]